MRLLKKALIPYPFELKKILNSTQHRYVPESHAITLTCKSYEFEYSCAVTPQVRQTGNRLSGPAGTAYASLLT